MAPSWKYEKENGMYKIVTNSLKENLIDQILSHWKGEEYDNKKRFPGAQPVSIERKNIHFIKRNKYVVCAKLDGERFFLYSTQIPENLEEPEGKQVNISFIINRNFEFFIVTIQWSENVYKNKLLLDGELIGDEFIIHDSIIVNGENVKNKNWDIRWKTTNKFLVNQHTHSSKNSIKPKLKKFYTTSQIANLFNEIKIKKIKSDGIVFYPIEKPVKYRNQPDLYKWKPPGHHTVDFKVIIKDLNVHLMTWSRGKDYEYTKIQLSDFPFDIKNGDVVEFNYNNKMFIPLKKRNDKPVGNNLYTIRKTLLNIEENITQNDIIKILNHQQ